MPGRPDGPLPSRPRLRLPRMAQDDTTRIANPRDQPPPAAGGPGAPAPGPLFAEAPQPTRPQPIGPPPAGQLPPGRAAVPPAPPVPPPLDLPTQVEVLRNWVGALDRIIGIRTRVLLVLAAIAIGAS